MEVTGTQRRSGRQRGVGKWLLVMPLGVVATWLVIEVVRAAAGEPDASTGQAGSVFAVAGKVTPESYGLYLVDLKHGTISVYQYLSSQRKLRLLAVRNFTFDVQLDEYNTEPPPREIKKLVQQHKRLSETE